MNEENLNRANRATERLNYRLVLVAAERHHAHLAAVMAESQSPRIPERPFAVWTANWEQGEECLNSGDYDLTREAAQAEALRRAG